MLYFLRSAWSLLKGELSHVCLHSLLRYFGIVSWTARSVKVLSCVSIISMMNFYSKRSIFRCHFSYRRQSADPRVVPPPNFMVNFLFNREVGSKTLLRFCWSSGLCDEGIGWTSSTGSREGQASVLCLIPQKIQKSGLLRVTVRCLSVWTALS